MALNQRETILLEESNQVSQHSRVLFPDQEKEIGLTTFESLSDCNPLVLHENQNVANFALERIQNLFLLKMS